MSRMIEDSRGTLVKETYSWHALALALVVNLVANHERSGV